MQFVYATILSGVCREAATRSHGRGRRGSSRRTRVCSASATADGGRRTDASATSLAASKSTSVHPRRPPTLSSSLGPTRPDAHRPSLSDPRPWHHADGRRRRHCRASRYGQHQRPAGKVSPTRSPLRNVPSLFRRQASGFVNWADASQVEDLPRAGDGGHDEDRVGCKMPGS